MVSPLLFVRRFFLWALVWAHSNVPQLGNGWCFKQRKIEHDGTSCRRIVQRVRRWFNLDFMTRRWSICTVTILRWLHSFDDGSLFRKFPEHKFSQKWLTIVKELEPQSPLLTSEFIEQYTRSNCTTGVG